MVPHSSVQLSHGESQLQATGSLPTFVWWHALLLLRKVGLLPCTLPLVLSMAKWGPYFTLKVTASQEGHVIKKDRWQIISITNTCTVRKVLFGRTGHCKS